jgi:predicted AAA+ superfamily ATPase
VSPENGADIYVTGSNSRMLSSELATLLTGRYVIIPMFTLSFKEFLKFRNMAPLENPTKEFERYLKYGGLPGIHLLELTDEAVLPYINSIFHTILLKDVVAHYHVRDVGLLERISAFIFDHCGSITSAKKIADFLKSQRIRIGMETVQNYIRYLQDAHLIFKSGRFDIKGKKHLELFEKYYLSDIGIRHSLLDYHSDDIARLLENVVYLELLRRGYTVTTGKLGDLEVDFIAQKNSEKRYIQVCYLLASPETVAREFQPLQKIDDNYPKMVLSMDTVWGQDRDGIMRQNIVDFLLETPPVSSDSSP